MRIVRQVADALEYAHTRGVVHRDIKPENILLSDAGALVADFGIARAVDDESSRLTATGLTVGTPTYMSPEQASGDRRVGPASDVYSLASVTFEMLTGEAPYTGPNARAILAKRMMDPVPSPRRLRTTISPALDREIRRGLAASPADRHGSAATFATALESGAAAAVPARFRLTRTRVLAAAAGAVVIAAGALAWSRSNDEPPPPDNGNPVHLANALLARRTPVDAFRAMSLFVAALNRGDSAGGHAGIAYTFALFADWGWDFPGGGTPAELRARALEASEKAVAADSMSAAAWMSRAYVLSINDPYRLEGAIDAFRRSLRIDSLTSEGWYQFGQALMQLGEDSAATAAYRRAFALDPNRPMALMSLSALSLKSGRIEQAKGLIDSAVAASPTVTSPYVRVVRGRIAMQLGNLRAARDEAELALALDTVYSIPARSLLASVAWAEGNVVEALAELQRMHVDAGRGSISPTTARYLASALVAMGRNAEAVGVIERARPRGAYLWFYLQSPDFRQLESNRRFQAVVQEADPR